MLKEDRNMSNYVRKLIPFESCDIPAIQSWLEDMAKQGLFYRSCGFIFARFAKGSPKAVRYRLDFCDVVAGELPAEKAELYELSSWQVVGELKNDLVVLSTEDPDAPEIFSDHRHLIKPLKSLAKKHTAYWILFLFMFLFSRVAAPINAIIMKKDGFIDAVLQIGTGYYILLCIMAVLLLLEFILHFRSCRHLKKLIKGIEKGGELPSGEKYKLKSKIGAVLIPLSIPLIILWLIHLAIPMGVTSYKPSNDVSGLPFPTMQEINAAEYEYYAENIEKVKGSIAYISKKSDLLAPVEIEFTQDSSAFEHITGKREKTFRYDVQYREMRREEDAVNTFNKYLHLLEKDSFAEIVDTLDLSRDGIEMKLIVKNYKDGESDKVQHLIARYENRFIRVLYSGDSNLSEYAELYIAYLKA